MINLTGGAAMWWGAGLAGLGVGLCSGLLGIGGGVLIIPVLIFLFALPQKTAQGMSLAIMIPVTIMGAIRYYLSPDIKMDLWLVLVLATAAVIGTNLGVNLAIHLQPHILRKIFAVVLIAIGIRMFWP